MNDDFNLIEFLIKILEFYADKENYMDDPIITAKIMLDGGHQARFALEQYEKIKEEMEKNEENMFEAYFPTDFDKEKFIETWKKTLNYYNKENS